jgi:hypothetical protein
VAFDETWVLTRLSSGRALGNRTARDTRKFNTRALWASQNGGDHLAAGIGNLVGACFIGRTTDAEAQADALRMAKIECGVGYEETLARLSPQSRRAEGRSGFREFVFADGDGGVEREESGMSYVSMLEDSSRAGWWMPATPPSTAASGWTG